MHTVIQKVFISNVSLRFYAKSKFSVCFEVHIPVAVAYFVYIVYSPLSSFSRLLLVPFFLILATLILAAVLIYEHDMMMESFEHAQFWEKRRTKLSNGNCKSRKCTKTLFELTNYWLGHSIFIVIDLIFMIRYVVIPLRKKVYLRYIHYLELHLEVFRCCLY